MKFAIGDIIDNGYWSVVIIDAEEAENYPIYKIQAYDKYYISEEVMSEWSIGLTDVKSKINHRSNYEEGYWYRAQPGLILQRYEKISKEEADNLMKIRKMNSVLGK